jgi:heat shock protein HslJ
LGLACLAGCNTAGDKTVTSTTVITSENIGRIVGIRWILQKISIDGDEYDLAGDRPYIEFSDDGRISGFTSINRCSGSMQLDDQGGARWSPFASTKMAGPPELMKQESIFLEALPRVQRLSIEGTHLYAQSEDDRVRLIFRCSKE